MRKLFVCVFVMSFLVTSMAWASATKRFDPGTETCRTFNSKVLWEGKEIFNNSCKSCHYRGNDQSASFLHTESKIMRGWNRVFYKKTAQCAKAGEWDHLSNEELMRLNDYLFRYAADSYDPYDAADCG